MTTEEVRSRSTCAGVYVRYNRIWMERCAFSFYSYCYEKFSEIFTTQYIVMFTHVKSESYSIGPRSGSGPEKLSSAPRSPCTSSIMMLLAGGLLVIRFIR